MPEKLLSKSSFINLYPFFFIYIKCSDDIHRCSESSVKSSYSYTRGVLFYNLTVNSKLMRNSSVLLSKPTIIPT